MFSTAHWSRITHTALLLVAIPAYSSASIVVSQDFTGNPANPFDSIATNLSTTPPFSVAGDAFTIDFTPAETTSGSPGTGQSTALINQTAPGGDVGLAFPDGDFILAVDVNPTTFTNTGGLISLRAFENNDAFLNFGVGLGVQTGFGASGDDATLQFFVGNSALPSPGPTEAAVFQHSTGGNETAYRLTLIGDFDDDVTPLNGDLVLTGIFTPDAAQNPNGLPEITISTTIDQATLGTLGLNFGARTFFGIQQSGSTNNDMNITYDNFLLANTADLASVIPEPASLGLLTLGMLCLVSRRRV
ncbi:MAG: PEP-CTERM sorting domain-containing protein [Planctomycetota bacterium]